MIACYFILFQSNIVITMFSYLHYFSVVKIDNIFLYFGSLIIFIAQNNKRRMNNTFTIKYIFFAFMLYCSIYFLLTYFTTQVILKILETIWTFSLWTRTNPIFHAKIVTIFNWSWTYTQIEQRISFGSFLWVAISTKLSFLIKAKTGHNRLIIFIFGHEIKSTLFHLPRIC